MRLVRTLLARDPGVEAVDVDPPPVPRLALHAVELAGLDRLANGHRMTVGVFHRQTRREPGAAVDEVMRDQPLGWRPRLEFYRSSSLWAACCSRACRRRSRNSRNISCR